MIWAAVNQARDSIARSADLLAEEIATAPGDQAAELQGRCDALSTLAGALSSLAWGPQGGRSTSRGTHGQSYEYGAEKKPAGFGA